MLRSNITRLKTQVSFGVSILFGVALAVVGVELLLKRMAWAPKSIGATDGLRVIFTPDTLYQNDSTPHLEVDREDGRRTSKRSNQSSSVPQIEFYGDSMTFGAGVSAEETFPFTIQSSLGTAVAVKNFGVIGFGPDQSTKLAFRSMPHDETTVGVLVLFPGNDFKDLLHNRLVSCIQSVCAWSTTHLLSPYLSQYRIINLIRGGLMGKEAIPASVITTLFSDTETIYGSLSEEERRFSEAQLAFVLSEFSRIFSLERTVVVVIPPYSATLNPTEDTTESHRVAVSIANRLGLITLPLNNTLLATSYLPNDHHLNKEGHKRVSDALAPALKSAIDSLGRRTKGK